MKDTGLSRHLPDALFLAWVAWVMGHYLVRFAAAYRDKILPVLAKVLS